MEQTQQQQQQQNEEGIINGGGSGSSNSGNKSSFLCRQSTTRWTPTAEQIRILKDLYYNNGVRSPSAEQIQKISAKLRQYGKIEGKNVFYWFQNHKARERQKKRLTTTTTTITEINNNHPPPPPHHHHHPIPTIHRSGAVWRSHEDPTSIYTSSKLPGGPSPSASTYGLHGFNQLGNYGYGSLAMEKSFRDCSISPGGNSGGGGGGGSMVHNFMWAAAAAAAVGVHDHHHHHHPNYHHQPLPSSSYTFQKKCYDNNIETLQDDEDEDQDQEDEEEDLDDDHDHDHDHHVPRELETLPLFPMHEENHNHNHNNNNNNNNNNNIVSGNFCNMMMKQETENYYMNNTNNWYHYSDTTTTANAATGMAGCCSRASLELTLNSYSSATGYSQSPNAP